MPALVAGLLAMGPARAAQEASAPGTTTERLTVEQAVRIGLEQHPQVAAAQAAVAAAERSYRALAAFPSLNLTLTRAQGTSANPTVSGGTADTFVGLGDTLDTSGQRRYQAAAARAQLVAAREQLAETSLGLAQQIRDAYWSLAAARAQRALVQESLQDSEQLDRLTHAQVQVGAVPRVDAIRSAIDRANVRQSAVGAEGAERTALAAFNLLLTRPAAAPEELAGSLAESTVIAAATPNVPDLAALTRQAIARRPLVRAAKAQVEAARFGLKQARAARRPDLSVDYDQSLQQPLYSVLIGIRMPLLDFGAVRNSIKAAAAAQRQAEAQERAAEQTVTLQVAQAYTDLTQARELAASYRSEMVSPAGTLLTAAQQGYRQGGTGLLPVLDAQTTLRTARTGYVNSLLALYKAEDELQAATGEPATTLARMRTP